MTIRLYVDEHVPWAAVVALRKRGVDVLTTQEDQRSGESDVELMDRALHLDRVLVT
jgi:predicted nuclease of predicted toxin-antitoxin system